MGKKNVANLFKGNKSMPHSHGGALSHATHGAANFHKSGANAFHSHGPRNGTGFAAAAAGHGSSIAGAGGNFKSPKMRTDVGSILGYATKFGDAMDGIEKALALAKYGMEMVSSSFPTEDLNYLASQLETALNDAERGAMETCQQVPETRYLCAVTLGRLAATSKECRDYLTRYRQRSAVDRTFERKKIAEEMGVLYQRLREDALAYWKEARHVATTRHERGAGEMQMVPAGYDQGWVGPAAAAGGRGPYPGVPENQTSMMNSMAAASSNAQRYGQPFGFNDAAMAAVRSAGRGGLSGVPMGGGGAITGPAALGGAGPYGTGSAAQQGAMTPVGAWPYGTGSAAQQGAMTPYQGPSQVPLGGAAAAAAAAFAASTKKPPHQRYATTDSYQTRFPAITGPSAAPAAALGLTPTPAAALGLAPTPAAALGLAPTPAAALGLAPTPAAALGLAPTPAAALGLAPTPAAAVGPTSAPAAVVGPTSGVQWDSEGRLLYFHPAYQRWFYCPMGSDQGRPFYFNPLTEEKHFGYFQHSSGW